MFGEAVKLPLAEREALRSGSAIRARALQVQAGTGDAYSAAYDCGGICRLRRSSVQPLGLIFQLSFPSKESGALCRAILELARTFRGRPDHGIEDRHWRWEKEDRKKVPKSKDRPDRSNLS